MAHRFTQLTTSIYVKILTGFAVILFLSFILGYGTLSQLNSVNVTIGGITPRIEILNTLGRLTATLDVLHSRLLSSGGATKADVDTLLGQISADMGEIEVFPGTGKHSELLVRLFEEITTARDHAARLFTGEIAARTEAARGLSDILVLAKITSEALSQEMQADTTALLAEQQEVIRTAENQLLTTQVTVLGIGMLLAMFLARMITSPIQILRDTVGRVAHGDYGAKVALGSNDEIGVLANAFNDMSGELAKYTKSLESTVAERTKELSEKVNALNMLTKEIDESSQMLIRRDLALTRATERLQELDTIKSEFMSVAAHQLRTPLSAIKWTLNLLLEGDAGVMTSEQSELIKKGVQSNERMIRLIDDMLTVTRIESGKTTFVTAPLMIGDMLKSVAAEVERDAKEKQINLVLNPIPEHRTVLADAEKLRFIFQNILENAVRYTPIGGTITAALNQSPEGVLVSIADSGIGIPESQRKNIFMKFFRADNAVKTVTDGTGLGLYVAKAIVERHHGCIWFDTVQGKGTTFFILIPNEDAPFSSGGPL